MLQAAHAIGPIQIFCPTRYPTGKMSFTGWMIYKHEECVYMILEILHRIGTKPLSLKTLGANRLRSEPQAYTTGSLRVRKSEELDSRYPEEV